MYQTHQEIILLISDLRSLYKSTVLQVLRNTQNAHFARPNQYFIVFIYSFDALHEFQIFSFPLIFSGFIF